MLAKAILIITIVNSHSTTIDYEFYEDLYHCRAVAEEIQLHVAQRQGPSDEVTCLCTKIEQITEEI